MLQRLSDRWSRLELALSGALALVVTALIMFNVVTRAMNRAVFWVDEAAVFCMIWMVFLATAVLVKRRSAVAVTVLVDFLPPPMRRLVGIFIDWCVLLFGVVLLVLCWTWFDPVTLVRLGGDLEVFSGETMNFIYQEKPNTVAILKFWVWLVVPLFAASVVLHMAANIVADPLARHMDKPDGGPTP